MSIRVASYNIEWFDDHFNADNTLKTSVAHLKTLSAIRDVLVLMNADVVMIIEGPNTTTTVGNQNTLTKLENFAQWAGLETDKAAIGFISSGRQEICMLYNSQKVSVSHVPGGSATSRSNPQFNGEFYVDTDENRIKEVYEFYRPPFEAKVEVLASNQVFYLMGVHTKSKGIFSSMDQVHLIRENHRNRMKLYAECAWIRKRAEEWLADGKRFAIMGDMNDGPGMDIYEMRHGKSAVETIMGDIFEPDKLLRHYIGRPKWKSTGWYPSTTRFTDRITEDTVRVMIDHILCSPDLPVDSQNPVRIWNPYEDDGIKNHKAIFKEASDHYPLTVDIAL